MKDQKQIGELLRLRNLYDVRNRFHDLLSQIGENVVVILSTHIVDDVSDLCLDSLDGKVWRKTIRKDEVAR